MEHRIFRCGNGLAVEPVGCRFEVGGDNTLRVEVLSDDFRLTVTGFDERDVVVEAVTAPSTESGGDADVEATT